MLLSIVWDVDPTMITILGRDIRWYGLCWAVGLMLAVWMVQKMYQREGLPEKWFDSLFVYMMVGIIAGARLGHCLMYTPEYYLANPIEILKIWEGGLASHGGVAGIILAVFLYSRKVTHRSMLWTFDRVVVPAGLTAAFIRIGNLMNSEIYGAATNLPWGFRFVRDGGVDAPFSHPTQIYEAIAYLLVFAVCCYLYYRTSVKDTKQGMIIGVAMIGIFVSRFLIEYLKQPQVSFEVEMRATYGIDMGQLLSIPFILWGVWCVWNAGRSNGEPVATKQKK